MNMPPDFKAWELSLSCDFSAVSYLHSHKKSYSSYVSQQIYPLATLVLLVSEVSCDSQPCFLLNFDARSISNRFYHTMISRNFELNGSLDLCLFEHDFLEIC